MSLELTDTAKAILQSENVRQAITLEIDGIDEIYSSAALDSDLVYGGGQLYGDPITYGGTVANDNVRSLISPENTTYNITQQLRVDQADVTSVQKLTINLVDEGEYFTFTFAPNQVVNDILGRDAVIRIAFIDGTYPDDAVVLVNGKIDQVDFGAGSCRIQVANALDLTRTTIFEKYTEELNGNTDIDGQSYLVPQTDDVLLPRFLVTGSLDTTLETYIRAEDEINKAIGKVSNEIFVELDGSGDKIPFFGTVAAAHDSGTTIDTIYRLQDNAIDLALKLLLSNEDEDEYESNKTLTSFVDTAAGSTSNALFFLDELVQTNIGVSVGDYVTSTGATNAENNFTNAVIDSITQDDAGTTIILESTDLAGGTINLVSEGSTSAVLSFKSQYNVLPIKSLLKPKHVDVQRFQEIKSASPSSLFQYDIMLTDTISDLKDFIANEIYKPSGFFNLPRKGRLSVGFSQPPLNTADTKILNTSTVKDANKIVISRTTNKNFYNGVSYSYEESRTEPDRFLKRIFTISADSISRINTRNNVLSIDAKGLRDDADTEGKISRQISRFLERFQFGAESMSLDVLYKTGFEVEIGDSVVVDGESLQISNSTTGSRSGSTRVFEVVNKKMNILKGTVRLELLDTAFSSSLRFGVISQSSFIDSGATTTTLPLKISFSSSSIQDERSKYTDYVGQIFRVRNQDYTFDEECTLISVGGSSLQITALSSAPSEDFIIEQPTYGNDASSTVKSLWKGVHTFMTPQVDVVSGIDNFNFTVAPADISLFSLNQPIEIHNDDYSITSSTSSSLPLVTNIDGGTNTITVSRDLGFTPAAGQKVEYIGFATDGGLPYALS